MARRLLVLAASAVAFPVPGAHLSQRALLVRRHGLFDAFLDGFKNDAVYDDGDAIDGSIDSGVEAEVPETYRQPVQSSAVARLSAPAAPAAA